MLHIQPKLAEAVCTASGRTAVCAGGFHSDHISEGEIEEVIKAIAAIKEEVVGIIKSGR